MVRTPNTIVDRLLPVNSPTDSSALCATAHGELELRHASSSLNSLIVPFALALTAALCATGICVGQTRKEGIPAGAGPELLAVDAAGDYVIGVEDLLYISVWKNPDLSREVPVRPDGKITLPLIDDVLAVGLTPTRLKEILTERWKSFITAPEVSVIVTQVNSLKVYMVGEIAKPGILVLKGKTRLLQALSLAGGFTQFADRSKVIVLRAIGGGNETRLEFNYKRIVSGGSPEDNVVLMPGDTVIVP